MTQLASDLFNRANNADLGATWDVLPTITNCQIVSNRVRAGSLGNANCSESYNGVTWPNDQYSEITCGTITGTNGSVGAAVRCSITDWSQYIVLCTSAAFDLIKFVAGSFTSLGTYNTTGAVIGDVVRIEVQGTTLNVYVNTVLRIGPVTDSDIASGRAGIYAEDATAGEHEIDSWAGGDFLTAATGPMFKGS